MMRTRWMSLGVWLVAFGIAGALGAQTVEAEAQTKKKEKPWFYFTVEAETAYIADAFFAKLPSSLTAKLTAAEQDAVRKILSIRYSTTSLALGFSLRTITPVNSPVAFYFDVAFLLGGYSAAGFNGTHVRQDLSQFRALYWLYSNLGVSFPIHLSDTLKLIPTFAGGVSQRLILAEVPFMALGLGLMVDLSLYGHISKDVALTGGLGGMLTPVAYTPSGWLPPGMEVNYEGYVQGGISAHFGVAFKGIDHFLAGLSEQADS